jgi:salicylate hydroxylase
MALAEQQITVLGGGIGGLSVAVALAKRGAKVTVFEQAAEITEVGAGIQVGPNGMAVLRALGVEGALAEKSVRAHGMALINGVTDKRVFGLDFSKFSPEQSYFFVHRADMVDVLADAARALGVEFRMSQQAGSVTLGDSGKATIRMVQGDVVTPDILIGADGLHSKVRVALNGAADPFFTGQVAWRTLVPVETKAEEEAHVYMGAGKHMVAYPLRDRKVMNIVAVQERREWAAEGWNFEDDPSNLRQVFRDFGGVAADLLERVDKVYLWGLFRHPVAETWHRGNVAILGDAAHPTLPFMAQGAVMALEDGWVLADELDKGADAAAGLAAYQARRRDRAVRVIEAANNNATNYHLRPGPVRTMAHTALKAGSVLAPKMALKKFDWIYNHDVTQGG